LNILFNGFSAKELIMAKEIIFEKLEKKEALLLLKAFDYDVDSEGYVVSPQGSRVASEENPKDFIRLEEAALTPGSLDVIDGTPISISKFIREKLEPK
jgi:hypothetical protein